MKPTTSTNKLEIAKNLEMSVEALEKFLKHAPSVMFEHYVNKALHWPKQTKRCVIKKNDCEFVILVDGIQSNRFNRDTPHWYMEKIRRGYVARFCYLETARLTKQKQSA